MINSCRFVELLTQYFPNFFDGEFTEINLFLNRGNPSFGKAHRPDEIDNKGHNSITSNVLSRKYCCENILYTHTHTHTNTHTHIHTHIYIQGVPGGKDLTSGECSLGQTMPI